MMRKDFLDGIRGWAALIVVLGHIMTYFLARALPALNTPYLSFATDGTLAVYVFFVVSGFALSTEFIEKRDSRILTSLALRRYVRLTIPIFCATLIAFALMKSGAMMNLAASQIVGSSDWLGQFYDFSPSFLGMLRFAFWDVYFAYQTSTSYNPVLWTMSIELAGSALVFALLALFGIKNLRFIVYAISAVVLSLLVSPLLAFVLGMILADLFNSKRLQRMRITPAALVFSIAAFVISVLFSTFCRDLYPDPRILSWIAFVLVAGIVACKRVTRLLEGDISRFLGKISFPLYLTHLPIICSFSAWLYITLTNNGNAPYIAVWLTFFSTLPVIFLAAFTFAPMENFAVDASRWLSDFALTYRSLQRASVSTTK